MNRFPMRMSHFLMRMNDFPVRMNDFLVRMSDFLVRMIAITTKPTHSNGDRGYVSHPLCGFSSRVPLSGNPQSG